MIKERYMVEGKRLDNGEMIKGYYVHDKGLEIDLSLDEPSTNYETHLIYVNTDDCYEVDPTTIQPVAVKPIIKRIFDGTKEFNYEHCPNCETGIINKKYKYCPHCGQHIIF